MAGFDERREDRSEDRRREEEAQARQCVVGREGLA